MTYFCQKKFEVLLSTLKNFGGPAGHEGALKKNLYFYKLFF